MSVILNPGSETRTKRERDNREVLLDVVQIKHRRQSDISEKTVNKPPVTRQNGKHPNRGSYRRHDSYEEGCALSRDQPMGGACKDPVVPEEVKAVLNDASFGQSRVNTKMRESTVTGIFTHKDEGELRKPGSDVILRIPKGAIPKGKSYTIRGEVHTNLACYDNLLKSKSDCFVGPIAEFSIEGGGEFKKQVEIHIPVCVRDEEVNDIQVFRLENEEQEEISKDEENEVNFKVSGDVIIIKTVRFSKFFCTIHKIEETVPDNMMLTLHASSHLANKKMIVQLRTAIHFRCQTMNDFRGERKQTIGMNMEEVESMTFSFREPTKNHPKDINVKFNLHEGYGWEPWCENGEQLDDFENTLRGETVMCSEKHRHPHSTVPLSDFSVEHKKQQTDSLTFHIDFVFTFPDGTVQKEKMKHVYRPRLQEESNLNARRNDSRATGEEDLMKRAIDLVSGEITTEIRELGIQLGVPEQKRYEAIDQQGPGLTTYVRVNRLLTSWRQSKGQDATPQVLREALSAIGRQDLAQQVEHI